MIVSGLHAANNPIGLPADLHTVQVGGLHAVKLLHIAGCEHTTAYGSQLRKVGVQDITLRLPDSLQYGHIPSIESYAANCVSIIREFYMALGVRQFQLDNEPNWTWTSPQYGPWAYQWFIRRVYHLIRDTAPSGVSVGLAPLSWSPALWSKGPQNPTSWTLDDWLTAYSWTDGGKQPSLWQEFDQVWCNVYWQSERQMQDPSFGKSYQYVYEHNGYRPVVVGEYASSAHQKTNQEGQPAYTPHEVEVMRIAQYPSWLRSADGMVQSAFAYISYGATPDWSGFFITDDVARAIGGV